MKRFIVYFFVTFAIASSAQAQFDIPSNGSEGVRMAPFRNGFAKITDNGHVYFIDIRGDKIELLETSSVGFNDAYAVQDYEREMATYPNLFPKTALKYRKGDKVGVISPKGDVLLHPEYDDVDTQFRQFWKVTRDGKISLVFPDKTFLPFFEDIGYLDGQYFDVKQDGKWNLFSKSQNRIVTSGGYEAFDYCGGCGSGSPYLYAQKGGKWGVIDWNEKILVPFEYEHTHHSMRSDNWVRSFSKEGQPLIVHIPTKKEFRDAEVLMGLLVIKKDNLYGAYGQDGEPRIPFEFEKIELPNDNSFLGYSGEYLITTKQRKKGVIDLLGKEILPPLYDDVKIYDDYLVVKRQHNTYLLNKEGKILFEIENGEIVHANEYFYSSGSKGMSIFKIKKRAFYGLYFAETGVYVAPEYYDIQFFDFKDEDSQQKYLLAEKNKLSSLFDTTGRLLLENLEGVSGFYNGPENLVQYVKNGQAGVYDLQSKKELIPAMYDRFEIWKCGDRSFLKANLRMPESEASDDFDTQRSHLYDLKGKKVLEADIAQLDTIDTKRCLIKVVEQNRSKYVLLDMDNMRFETLKYKAVYRINSTKVVLVSNDDKVGKLYDMAANKELKGTYGLDFVTQGYLPQNPGRELVILPFKGDMALIYNEKGYGYINEAGKVIVPPNYVWAFDFVGEGAMVCQSEGEDGYSHNFKMGFIDKKGDVIFPLEYDLINSGLNHYESYFLGNSVVLSKIDQYRYQYGLGDLRTGKELLPVTYTQIRSIQNGNYLLLQKDNKFGIADLKGKIIVSVDFDEILFDAPSYFDSNMEATGDIFPLLVYRDGVWKYIQKNGVFLSIVE